MTNDPTAAGMPARVRAWLDYELAYAAYWAGRSTDEPEYVPGPSVDELCAALPHAADQLERAHILGELRSELYNGEDLIIGELYLAAQEFPERMDHRYDYTGVGGARRELGPDVVRWLRDLGEFGDEGIDTETAEVMVRALGMEDEWADILADWGEMVPAHLVTRTVWHDGQWRGRDGELVLLHEAEAAAVRHGHATPEQLAEWKTEWRTWPRPVKTDHAGPWVVRSEWEEFLRLKGLTFRQLSAEYGIATAGCERAAEQRRLAEERLKQSAANDEAARREAEAVSAEYCLRVADQCAR